MYLALQAFSREPLSYRPFSLLQLPYPYDNLFSRFFNRQCLNCATVPSYPLVCLLCSTLVCLDDCCRTSHVDETLSNEAERHALSCGGGSCPFISVNSSVVCIVRERAGLVWGSVYLDSHGEEDMNLKRGKPMFLSEKRFTALSRDWLEQDFSRGAWNFIPIARLYEQIRDAYLPR